MASEKFKISFFLLDLTWDLRRSAHLETAKFSSSVSTISTMLSPQLRVSDERRDETITFDEKQITLNHIAY